jgi:hypothetical protein
MSSLELTILVQTTIFFYLIKTAKYLIIEATVFCTEYWLDPTILVHPEQKQLHRSAKHASDAQNC